MSILDPVSIDMGIGMFNEVPSHVSNPGVRRGRQAHRRSPKKKEIMSTGQAESTDIWAVDLRAYLEVSIIKNEIFLVGVFS